MKPLSEDTIADKVIRFVFGAFLGGVSGGLGLFTLGISDARGVLLWVGGSMALAGILAVILGNRSIERSLPDQWED